MTIALSELRDSYDWEQAFSVSSIRSATPWTVVDTSMPSSADVAEVIATEEGERDGAQWVGVFKLNDGRYVAVAAGCDYTGWDCQAGGEIMVANTREDILCFGMSDDERKRLGIIVNQSDMARTTPNATRAEIDAHPDLRHIDRGNGIGED